MATGTKDKNPIQEDYDAKFNDASPENSGRGADEPENLYEKEQNAVKRDGKPLNPGEQAKLDQMEAGLREGDLFEPSSEDDSPPDRRKLMKMVGSAVAGNRKYGWIGGGVVGLLAGAYMLFFPVLGPLHIYSNLFDHNFELNDSYRRSRTTRIMRSIFSANRTNRQLTDTPFKLKADLVDFEKFEQRMNSKGWQFEYDTNNKAIGLIDPNGRFVNLDNLSTREMRLTLDETLFKDTIPAWQMNKRVRTRQLISTFTGPRRGFNWTKLLGRDRTVEPELEKAKFLKESGLDDVPTNADSTVSVREQGVDSEGNPVVEADNTADLDETQRAVLEKKNAGASDAVALAAGQDVIKSRFGVDGKSLVTAIFVLGCVTTAVYEQDLVGDYERYTSALRGGSTYMLAVNEIQQGGDIDVGEVGVLFSEYNSGDLSFAESASWQRATGAPVTGPELDPELHVINQETNVVEGVLGGVGSFFSSIPLFSVLCAITGTIFFTVIDYAFSAVELIGGCLVSACLASAAKLVGQEAVFYLIGKLIAATVTSFVGFLIANPIMAANFLDQTFNLISSEESRTATPLSAVAYNSALADYKHSSNQNKPPTERYFSMDNSNSLSFALANLRMDWADKTPRELIASIFILPGQSALAAVNSGNVYAQTDLTFDNYGFQKYAFDPAYLDVDPYTHAEEVLQLIEDDPDLAESLSGVPGEPSQLARDFAVYCMGYNPSTGLVDKGPTTQMLPVFSDPNPAVYGQEGARTRNGLYQSICIEGATTHSDMYASIGRFVDDLELITSIQELSQQ